MNELIEMLYNTETGMRMHRISNCGMQVVFLHKTTRYEFIITDTELGAINISMEEYILNKLEMFLEELGVKTHA